jgi:hypothetical protein
MKPASIAAVRQLANPLSPRSGANLLRFIENIHRLFFCIVKLAAK